MWLRTDLIRTYTERVRYKWYKNVETTCAAPRAIPVVPAVVLDLDNLIDVDR